MKKLLLWDIDGTLLGTRPGVGDTTREEFLWAARKASGRDDLADPDRIHGSTDFAILHEIFANSGYNRKEADFLVAKTSPILNEKTSSPSYIDRTRTAIGGAEKALEALSEASFIQTYATGNLPARAQAKAAFFSLDHYLDPQIGGFGFWTRRRSQFLRQALELAEEKHQTQFQGIVFGDTPADIEGAREMDLPIVAITGGNYREEDLISADLVLENYTGDNLQRLKDFLLF